MRPVRVKVAGTSLHAASQLARMTSTPRQSLVPGAAARLQLEVIAARLGMRVMLFTRLHSRSRNVR